MEKFFTMNLEKFKAAYMKTEPVTITQKGPWLEAYLYARVCQHPATSLTYLMLILCACFIAQQVLNALAVGLLQRLSSRLWHF